LIWRELGLVPGAKVLEVCCAHSRHGIPLAQRGCRVTGVDISEEFITIARQRAQQAGVETEFIVADVRKLPVAGPFDAAIQMGNCFGYVDAGQMLAYLRQLAPVLRPGAGLLLDSGMIAECILPNLKPSLTYNFDGVGMEFVHEYDVRRSRLDTDVTFTRDGQSETRQFCHWVFTLGQVCDMLEAAEFEVVSLIGAPDGTPFKFGGQFVYVRARRRG
jgi:SAM-dependent methyltransferase